MILAYETGLVRPGDDARALPLRFGLSQTGGALLAGRYHSPNPALPAEGAMTGQAATIRDARFEVVTLAFSH